MVWGCGTPFFVSWGNFDFSGGGDNGPPSVRAFFSQMPSNDSALRSGVRSGPVRTPHPQECPARPQECQDGREIRSAQTRNRTARPQGLPERAHRRRRAKKLVLLLLAHSCLQRTYATAPVRVLDREPRLDLVDRGEEGATGGVRVLALLKLAKPVVHLPLDLGKDEAVDELTRGRGDARVPLL